MSTAPPTAVARGVTGPSGEREPQGVIDFRISQQQEACEAWVMLKPWLIDQSEPRGIFTTLTERRAWFVATLHDRCAPCPITPPSRTPTPWYEAASPQFAALATNSPGVATCLRCRASVRR
jgi:hypothetical protein